MSHELERAGADRATALRASLGPLIEMGDCDESLARIDTLKAAGAQAIETAPLEIMAAGLKGDFKRVDEALAIPERSQVRAHYRYVVDAYWYAVQGRFEDAAAALAKAGEFETVPNGGFLGTSLGMGALPAVVRIYQAEGREHEAQAMVSRFQEKVRKELGARHTGCHAERLAGRDCARRRAARESGSPPAGGDDAGAGTSRGCIRSCRGSRAWKANRAMHSSSTSWRSGRRPCVPKSRRWMPRLTALRGELERRPGNPRELRIAAGVRR